MKKVALLLGLGFFWSCSTITVDSPNYVNENAASGIVLSQTNEKIPNAQVQLWFEDGDNWVLVDEAVSDESGSFVLESSKKELLPYTLMIQDRNDFYLETVFLNPMSETKLGEIELREGSFSKLSFDELEGQSYQIKLEGYPMTWSEIKNGDLIGPLEKGTKYQYQLWSGNSLVSSLQVENVEDTVKVEF